MVSTNTHSNCTAVSSEFHDNSNPRDIAQTPGFCPARPTKVRYPYTRIGDKKGVLTHSKHDWLEYSIEEDASFCYPCRLFGIGSSGTTRPEPVFVSKGFRDQKHAAGTSGTLSHHANCHSHIQALNAWQQHVLNTKQGTTTVGVIKKYTFRSVKTIVMLHNYGLRSCLLKTIVFMAVNIVFTSVNIVLQLL